MLGPLAGLLIMSGPRTPREWWWLSAAAAWSAIWLLQSGSLADQVVRALGVLLTGAFLVLTISGPGRLLRRALWAVGLAFAGVSVGCAALGISWAQIHMAVARRGWEVYRLLAEVAVQREAAGSAGAGRTAAFMETMAEAVGPASELFPGLLAIAALAGLVLAWFWYHRIARRPLGQPMGRLAELRFSDHLIWSLVLALGTLVAGVGGWASMIAANLLLFGCALYAVRGLAVAAASLGRLPWSVLLAGVLVTMFLLPFAVTGLVMLGIADTWIDFRRRVIHGSDSA